MALAWVVLFAVYAGGLGNRPGGGTPPAAPPNLNPGNIQVTAVTGVLVAGPGAPHNISFVRGTDLCPRCPMVPVTDYSLNPPGARLTLFFNLTNSGSVPYVVGSFTLNGTGGNGTDPFQLYGVICCTPIYDEVTESIFMTAYQTMGFEAIFSAPSIPANAPQGYRLTLTGTYSPA